MVTSLMSPDNICVQQDHTHELHFYFPVSFTTPDQNENSCEVKRS